MMNRLVCFDSQICAWVFRDKGPDKGNADNYDKAKRLVRSLDKAGYRLLVPNIVLSENACIYPESKQNEFFNNLPTGLIIGSFTNNAQKYCQEFFINVLFSKIKNSKRTEYQRIK